ncbi:MAG: 2-oxo-4-hydroxy-4-carboxy-5-ureidoimidazoline decarboxylase [Pseudomonadota bacterium]
MSVFHPHPAQMDRDGFMALFGAVYEHSPWIAAAAYDAGLPRDAERPEGLARALAAPIDAAAPEHKRALLDAHPDLAGRLAVAGALTATSSAEQASAGLDQCSEAEYDAFARLNASYRARFGFPFIMAVRGRNRSEILAAFQARLENSPETEFETALREVHRIAYLRLDALAGSGR